MGFLICKRTAANGSVRYEKLKPLKLGGRDGLIARFVRTLSDAESRSWKLDNARLLQLAGEVEPDGAVLFDLASQDTARVCLYEVSRIHGSCRDSSTQIALDLSVLIDREAGDVAPGVAQGFVVASSERPKSLRELLSLTGGPGGGDWKWAAPTLQIGATVVAPHAGGSSCPNCSCGLKASGSSATGACLS